MTRARGKPRESVLDLRGDRADRHRLGQSVLPQIAHHAMPWALAVGEEQRVDGKDLTAARTLLLGEELPGPRADRESARGLSRIQRKKLLSVLGLAERQALAQIGLRQRAVLKAPLRKYRHLHARDRGNAARDDLALELIEARHIVVASVR